MPLRVNRRRRRGVEALVHLMLCVPLLAAAKVPERFDVRAFGAVGDGVVDDQPALTRAARAVAQNKGGVLYCWSWLASRGIAISNVAAVGCTSGFYVANFNQPMTADDKWWRFDIRLSNFSARDCKDDSLLVRDAAGVTARGVRAENRRIRLLHARDCSLDGVDLRHGDLIVGGQPDGGPMQSALTLDVELRSVHIDCGSLDLRNAQGLTCSGVRITRLTGEGLRMSNVFNSRLESVDVANPATPATHPVGTGP